MKKLIYLLFLTFISLAAFSQDTPPFGATVISPNFTWYKKIVAGDTSYYGYSNNNWVNFARRNWVKTQIATKADDALVEHLSNKAIDFSTANNTLYPTVLAAKNYADGLIVGLLNDRGSYNASSNVYPSSGGSGASGTVLKGNLWAINGAGTLGGAAVGIGDWLRALTNTPGQTSANWSIVKGNFGYVPENIANKQNSLIADGTGIKYPTVDAVNAGIATTVPTSRTVAGFPLSFNVTLATLTNGYGISGTAYNGSTARTWLVDSTVIVSKTNLASQMALKLSLIGGNMTGDINYLGGGGSPTNPLAGKGIYWTKNTDYAKIYYESTGDTDGSSSLIFETGDNRTGGEGVKFRNYDSGLNNTKDYFIADILGVTIGDKSTAFVNFLELRPSSTNLFQIQSTSAGIGPANLSLQPDGGNLNIGYATDQGYRLSVNGIALATQYRLSALNEPVSTSTSSGVYGEIRWTLGYMYLCVATNTWVRAALSTW